MADTSILKAVALIPARAGSVRVPHKNIRPLNSHPLIAYTIAAARASGVFDALVVSTDSQDYARVARHYGAEVPFLRDAAMAGSTSPDIEWVLHALDALQSKGRDFEVFSILRPTSPFRKPETIRRAWSQFTQAEGVDSLRAVEPVEQHPGKMWVVRGDRMTPLLPLNPEDAPPWHSQQKASLPKVHVQNASLEIAWTEMARRTGSIAGSVLMPFLTEGDEGLDINGPLDWWRAEHLLSTGEARLPAVAEPPYPQAASQPA